MSSLLPVALAVLLLAAACDIRRAPTSLGQCATDEPVYPAVALRMEGVWRLTMVDTAASTNSSEAIILEISSPRTALKPTTSCVPVPPHLWLDYDDTRLRDASSERPNRGEGWIRSEDEIRLSFNIYYGEPAVGDTALTTHSGTVTKMKPVLWVGSYQMSHRGPDYQIEQTAGIWRLEALPPRTSAD